MNDADIRNDTQHRPAPIEAAWLARVQEDILEPDLPIVDPHHHLWARETQRYLRTELDADIGSGHDIRATVFVECYSQYRTEGDPALRPLGETEFAARMAGPVTNGRGRTCELMAGIVGHADLLLGDAVQPVLAAHVAAGQGRFRGIRHATPHDPLGAMLSPRPSSPGVMTDPRFQAGFKHLSPLGLSFDAWLLHPQIGELTDLARENPQTEIVLDHVGGVLGIGPYALRRHEVFDEWRRDITALAGCGNVSVKLGGMGMAMFGFDWATRPAPASSRELADAWRPFVATCIEAFGAERCMFESNFPVDKHACSYAVLWNAFKRLAKGASDAERAALFSGAATRFYRLSGVS